VTLRKRILDFFRQHRGQYFSYPELYQIFNDCKEHSVLSVVNMFCKQRVVDKICRDKELNRYGMSMDRRIETRPLTKLVSDGHPGPILSPPKHFPHEQRKKY